MSVLPKISLHDPVFCWRNKLSRVCWQIVYYTLFRYSPIPLFAYRRCILHLFGSQIGAGARIYPSTKIWLPNNLILDNGATLGPDVKIYNQGVITVGRNAIVSQGAHLCASTHDYNDPVHPLILAPISIGDNAWVCADAFIGPGVTVSEGAVVGARSVLTKTADAWQVYAGNPAVKVNDRRRFN